MKHASLHTDKTVVRQEITKRNFGHFWLMMMNQ